MEDNRRHHIRRRHIHHRRPCLIAFAADTNECASRSFVVEAQSIRLNNNPCDPSVPDIGPSFGCNIVDSTASCYSSSDCTCLDYNHMDCLACSGSQDHTGLEI